MRPRPEGLGIGGILELFRLRVQTSMRPTSIPSDDLGGGPAAFWRRRWPVILTANTQSCVLDVQAHQAISIQNMSSWCKMQLLGSVRDRKRNRFTLNPRQVHTLIAHTDTISACTNVNGGGNGAAGHELRWNHDARRGSSSALAGCRAVLSDTEHPRAADFVPGRWGRGLQSGAAAPQCPGPIGASGARRLCQPGPQPAGAERHWPHRRASWNSHG